jgi:hypothetical protein
MVRNILVLSTAHITKDTDANMLNYAAWVQPTAYGWFITRDPEMDYRAPIEELGMPKDLAAVHAQAQYEDCDYILLDRDADVCPGLLTYKWE